MTREYRIYLEPCYDEKGNLDIPGGYLIPYVGINEPMYARGSYDNAKKFTDVEAIKTIIDYEESGWDCRAIPKITRDF